MAVIFKSEGHIYESIDEDLIDWLGVTTIVSNLKEPFNPFEQSIKSSKKKKSKWYGILPEDIRDIWKSEGERSTVLGNWYHKQRESDILEIDTLERNGVVLPIIRPIYDGDIKYAPDQSLTNGIYPEHFIYLKSIGVCGQSDRVEVVNNVVSIADYKSNKEIKTQAYANWEGVTQKLLTPVSHLEDHHINHYSLQLSFYLYMILKHNPQFIPGKLIVDHVMFEEEGRDKYDYPIYRQDDKGDYIVKELKPYELPYLKTEVKTIIDYIKDNREQFKTKK